MPRLNINPRLRLGRVVGPVMDIDEATWVSYMGQMIVDWYNAQGVTHVDIYKCARFSDETPWLHLRATSPKFAGETHNWKLEADPAGSFRGGFATSWAWTCRAQGRLDIIASIPINL